MKILFLTMNDFNNIDEHSIYPDLARCFCRHGHSVTIVTPKETKYNKDTNVVIEHGIHVIRVKTGNLFNVNMKTKLISRATLGKKYLTAINQYTDGPFDLILFTTPPTTLAAVVKKIKNRDHAYTYLMLKDIFPQNAVDLGLIAQHGIAFRVLRLFEKRLYKVSDSIGCMSDANVKFLLKQDPWINKEKVEVCPNALEISISSEIDKIALREKYNLPTEKMILIYGGGMGKAQGIDFLISCIENMHDDKNVFFVISGSGPYIDDLKQLSLKYPKIVSVIEWKPVSEYEEIVKASDIGLIFLNYHFKIPNYPSRLLLYMQFSLPILAATDLSSDVGKNAEKYGYGFWCESKPGNEEVFSDMVQKMNNPLMRKAMGDKSRSRLETMYNVDRVYNIITQHMR